MAGFPIRGQTTLSENAIVEGIEGPGGLGSEDVFAEQGEASMPACIETSRQDSKTMTIPVCSSFKDNASVPRTSQPSLIILLKHDGLPRRDGRYQGGRAMLGKPEGPTFSQE
jgi:hypothetical protein